MDQAKKLILDMDTGIDDAMAIAYALGSQKAELVGVTCSFGNVTNETAVRNTLDLLALFGRPDIPVCRGAGRPVGADSFAVSEGCLKIHGANGIGGVALPHCGEPQKTMAADFILEAAEKYGSDLILVPTGALTNLAAAIEKDIDTVRKIGRIVFMGGALTVAGNVSPYAEANIWNDPQAAKIVLESGIPMTMVGLDVTLKILLPRKTAENWAQFGAAGKVLSDMVCYYIDHELGGAYSALHDPLAVGIALDPSLVETYPFAMTVLTEGEAAGRTLARSFPHQCQNPSVQVALSADPRFLQTFNHTLVTLFKSYASSFLKKAGQKLSRPPLH